MGEKPKYSLRSFNFKNFKGIHDVEIENLPPHAHWIFLTGENGFGKTSILQAIATSLAGVEDHTYKFFNETGTKLISKLNGTTKTYGVEKEGDIYKYSSSTPWEKFTLLACYGSSRLNTYVESSSTSGETNTSTSNLYDSRSLLENIEYQLSRWYAKDKDKEFRDKYKYVTSVLIDILQIHSIEVDYKTDQVYYRERDQYGNPYERITKENLASGYRNLIALVGDMILRLFRTDPSKTDPSKLEGIVIIDELDLHLHPKWQKRLPEILTRYFPRVQFIVSTHSPIPLLGAPKDSVFLTVHRTKEQGIMIDRLIDLEQEISKLTPNLLLNSPIFGYAEIFSSNYKTGAEIYTAASTYELTLENQVQEELMNNLSPEKQAELKRLLNK